MVRTALLLLGAALTVGTLAALGAQAAPSTNAGPRAQIRELEAEVQGIDADATAAADAHAAAVRRVDDLRARIARTRVDLAATRAARTAALQRLSDRLVAIYREEPPSLVEMVLSSGDLSAAIDAQQALEIIGEGDRRIVDQLGATRARLTGLVADLEGDRAAAEANVAATRDRSEELNRLIARRRAVLDEAQGRLDAQIARDSRARAAGAEERAAAAARARDERAAEATLRRRAESSATPAPDPAPAPAAPASGSVAAHLARIAQCESGGDPTRVSGPYRGKYQFDLGTWQSVGGTGDPAAAPEAEQDRRAAMLYALRGSSPWPVCQYR